MSKAQRLFKRILVIADLHCGHRVGLTPPQWQLNPANEEDAKWLHIQEENWQWYARKVKSLRPVDLLVVAGDCVDGASIKAEGRDSIRTKRRNQIDMACECIAQVGAKAVNMVYGTRYHVRDWEDDISRTFDGDIGAHNWPRVNGVILDVKHKVGGSQSPAVLNSALAKANVWNLIWSEDDRQPRADIIIRGHVHRYDHADQRGKLLFTCPALQGVGTEYGSEQCEGVVDFGLFNLDIYADGSVAVQKHLFVGKTSVAKVTDY